MKEFVVVHTIGKVASSSVYRSLGRQLDLDCYHTHFLEPVKLQQVHDKLVAAGKPVHGHVQHAREVQALLGREDCRARVISLVRDPVARSVSAFFENIELFGIDPADPPPVEQTIRTYLEKYPPLSLDEWIEAELNGVFGLELLALPFPRRTGAFAFEHGGHDFLLMKAELPDRQKRRALQLFLDLDDDFELASENLTESKALGGYYAEFKRALGQHAEVLQRSYQSPYCRLFYQPEEIAAFRRRWS